MIRLSINKNCVNCGNCEVWLPGLYNHIERGYLMISENNPIVNGVALDLAINGCPMDALSLEEVK